MKTDQVNDWKIKAAREKGRRFFVVSLNGKYFDTCLTKTAAMKLIEAQQKDRPWQ